MCDNRTTMAGKEKINKDTAVQMCADLLYAGKTRKEILQTFAAKYKASARGIDNWIKDARVVVSQRQQAAEEVRAKVDAEQIEEIAKELGISRKRVAHEYARLAFMDVRKLYNEDGTLKNITELDDDTAAAVAGVEVFEECNPITGDLLGTNRKVKRDSKLTALDGLSKLMGYAPQPGIKAEIEDKKGDKVFKVTLNLS